MKKDNIVYGIESVKDSWEELAPLAEDHSGEVDGHNLVLDIDKDFYNSIEEAGAFLFFTARKEGRLIGYATFIIRHNPHYKGVLFGVNDAIFVEKKYRASHVGMELVSRAEEVLKEKIGVEFITYHAKVKHSLTKFMRRMGYDMYEHMYMKEV